MPPDACPARPDLEAFLLGRLPPGRAAVVQRHLDHCPTCPAVMDGMKLESRLMRVLAAGPPDPGPPAAGLEGLMARLERLAPGRPADETATDAPTEDEVGGSLHPPERPDELGRLADYRVLELLGRGGMGFVFRAEDTRLVRPVGLKVLRPRTRRDPVACARFLREARAMAAVKHDHVAVVHEVGVAAGPRGDDVPFLAMELLAGENLLAWMRANPRPPVGWVVRVGRQTAGGLAAAHALGLVHRDVKPGNLWLEAPPGWADDPPAERPPLGAVGRVKVIDFGLAAPADGGDLGAGAVAGTPAYMAPEQFAGGPPDARSDLFALGCVLYELAAGEPPFPGRGLAARFYAGDPPPAPARDLNPAVPAALSALIARLLAENPDDRPPTARAVERELAAVEAELDRPKPRSWWPAAVAVLLLLGLGAGAWQAWGPRPADLAPPTDPPGRPPDRPPFPDGPPDEWWCKEVADLPSQEQFRTVARKVAELNPGYDPKSALGWVEKEGVIRFTLVSDDIRDIRPVRGLPDVRTVRVAGTAPGRGRFTDLSPLAGLRLHSLLLDNNPGLTDLGPVAGARLVRLVLSGTGVRSLAGVDGDLLEELNVAGTPVSDLGPVRGMPRLRVLDCTGCPVASFEPLAGTAVRVLRADVRPGRDAAVIRRMPKLEFVNGRPVNEIVPVPDVPGR